MNRNTYDCKKCGAKHGMGIEDISIGSWEPLDLCRDCLFGTPNIVPKPIHFNLECEWGGEARCMTSDGRNVNMAEELNNRERELISAAKRINEEDILHE